MSRADAANSPTPSPSKRTSTAIRFKKPIHDRLAQEAVARDVSINWLVNRAVEDFLERLIPVDEMKWTR